MRIVVVLALVAIVASLASALVFIYRNKEDDAERTVRALTLRVGLSVALFLLLIGGYYFGLIGEKL